MGTAEDRLEIRNLAASLRAHLAQQQATGARGVPPGPPEAIRHAPAIEHTVQAHPTRASEIAPLAPALFEPPQPKPPPPHAAPATTAPSEPASIRLPVLRDEVASCVRCSELAASRTNTVFSRGNAGASLCFVGEAPGADEDAQGVPFVGRAGQLLDKMIAAMGLDPARDVYICNIIKCRPPENRKPTPQEVASCIPYLHEQLALIRPKVIVALGNTSVAALLGTKLGITKIRGSWKLYKGTTLVMPTYHPSYLLRPSAQLAEAKKQTWEDLQMVMQELGIAPRKQPQRPADP